MRGGLAFAALAFVGLALGSGGPSSGGGGSSGGGSSTTPDKPPPGKGARRKLLEGMLAAVPELDDAQRTFLVLVARGESGFNFLVGLGVPSLFPPGTQPNLNASVALQNAESAAAHLAYNRNIERFRDCDSPAPAYGFGAGGWFGILPANGLAKLVDTPFRCWEPRSVFDPARSIVMALAIARALQGWEGFQAIPTIGTLRRGWGLPSAMGRPLPPEKLEKFQRHAREIGATDALLDVRLNRFPSNPVETFQRLSAVAATHDDAAVYPDLFDYDPEPEGTLELAEAA